MTLRNDILQFCNEYLQAETFKDYCHNGLQIEGKKEISNIVIGVSLSREFIEKSIEENADMIIVHHGLFRSQIGDPPRIKGIFRNRIKLILENDINLCGYHLPLDAHPEIGNNISLAHLFKLEDIETLHSPYYGDIGYLGNLTKTMNFLDFVKFVDTKLHTKSQFLASGPSSVSRVGIVSGGGSLEYSGALEKNADTFVTGDIKENIVREVEEYHINFINAGHYNTEKLGVKNLGRLLSTKFDVKIKFIDVPCNI